MTTQSTRQRHRWRTQQERAPSYQPLESRHRTLLKLRQRAYALDLRCVLHAQRHRHYGTFSTGMCYEEAQIYNT